MSRDRDNWCLPCRPCGCKPQNMPVCGWNPWPKPIHHDDHCDICSDSAMRLKLFCDNRCCDNRGTVQAAPPVVITNPWNCRERATVCLGIDECGNLVVSVRRENC